MKQDKETRDILGLRRAGTSEVIENIKTYLHKHPANYQGQVDTLLELIYHAYTEYNSAETPEFKAVIDPLEETLKSLAGSDAEADRYMNTVFSLCSEYERQAYIEGIKVEARLMMELAEN